MTVLNTSAVLNRRSLLLGATLAGTTGLLAACSGGNGSSAGSAQSSSNLLETIKSAGKIRIGVEGTYRPYTYTTPPVTSPVSSMTSPRPSPRTWA